MRQRESRATHRLFGVRDHVEEVLKTVPAGDGKHDRLCGGLLCQSARKGTRATGTARTVVLPTDSGKGGRELSLQTVYSCTFRTRLRRQKGGLSWLSKRSRTSPSNQRRGPSSRRFPGTMCR